jgi:GH24 family phage-related lysozyme (muramidase)
MTGINDHMKVSRHALLLLASYEGKPRLKARRCEGGKFELSYGCTTWPDGRPIGAADFCNEDQALQLFAFHLHRFEAVVEKHTTVALNQFQYDALVCLAYNIGPDAFAKCSALRLMNEKKWEEAAEAFGLYVFATSTGPSLTQQKMARHKGQWRIGADGDAEWIGPQGQACSWRMGLLGLQCRHYAEGLLSLAMPWEAAVDPDTLMLETVREWDAGQNRWEDTVTDRTPFSVVKARAKDLPRLTLEADTAPGVNAPFNLDEYEKRVDAATKAPAPATNVTTPAPAPTKPVDALKPPVATTPAPAPAKPAPAPPKPAPQPAPKPSLPVPSFPPKLEYEVPKGSVTPHIPAPAKPMENTRRFWGAFLFYGGKIVMAVGVTTLPGKFAVAFGEAYGVFVKDPVLFGLAIDFLTVCSGWTMDHCGAWMRKWGERRATRPMVSGGEPHLPGPSTQTSVVSTQSLTVSTVGGP